MMIGKVNKFAQKSVYSGKWGFWCQDNKCDHTFDHPHKFHKFLSHLPELQGSINYLEFGVHRGESISLWLANNTHSDSRFVGFDSFEGLPENWTKGFNKGHFSTAGVAPNIDDERCHFQVGWFNETLPQFVESFSFDASPTVVHLDGDLYSSTVVVLFALAAKIKVGDILIFDDFSDSLNVFRAFQDYLSAYSIQYELVAKGERYNRVAIRILATVTH